MKRKMRNNLALWVVFYVCLASLIVFCFVALVYPEYWELHQATAATALEDCTTLDCLEGETRESNTKVSIPPNDPHWEKVSWLMEAKFEDGGGLTWWRDKWYYKRPGYCSVCGTKGMFVSNLTVYHDRSITDIYMILEVIKLFRCPNCGNLFTEPKKEEP